MKEIEILVEVKSSREKALEALAQFETKGVKRTLDIYFYDPLRTDLQPDDNGGLLNAFRIRQKENEVSMAYKIDHFENENWSHSDEYETKVEDLETMNKIIEQLGLKELIRIDNEKHTFVTEQYEIVLEDVADLGLFMEVEKLEQVSDDKVSEVKDEIRTFLKNTGIEFGEEQTAGKPELMLRKIGSV